MKPRSFALLLLLAAAPSSATAAGFDFALERFAVSGAVSFVDEFDDGQPWEANGFLLTVEDVRAADYRYYAGPLVACFARDGLVAMLRGMEPDSFLWRPIHSCHLIDRAAISGPVILRLSAYAVASGL